MAKKMPYTDPQGVDHPDAVWYPVETNFCHPARTGRVLFYGYHNAAAAEANRRPLDGAQKAYDISGPAAYAAVVGVSVGRVLCRLFGAGDPGNDAVAVATALAGLGIPAEVAAGITSVPLLGVVAEGAYILSEETLDTPSPTEEDPDRMVGFFAAAEDVTVNLMG